VIWPTCRSARCKGLSAGDADHLKAAFAIGTIRELATNK
jgi:hypothetical protein